MLLTQYLRRALLLITSYKACLLEMLHINAQAFIQRLGFISVLLLQFYTYLVDISFPVYLREDKTAHPLQSNVGYAGSFEELLGDLIGKAFILHVDHDYAFIGDIPMKAVGDPVYAVEIIILFCHSS